jgi:uncharacterized damage-inducible protein DinB
MEPSLPTLFLNFSVQKLIQLTSRIQDCLERLSSEQVWARGAASENAVGNLVLHLCGNVLPAERLLEQVTIQSYRLTVLEAVCHVVEHFAQHTGQIIFATKQLTGQDLGYYKHLNKPAGHDEKTP